MAVENPMSLSPVDFERYVKRLLEDEGVGLAEFEAQHPECVSASDGDYTFDVTARFRALGADCLVLVECKRWSRPIECETVQALEQKRASVRAQKAMLVTTSEFRRGAVEFAVDHRIALAVVKDGSFAFGARSAGGENPCAAWLPKFSAWLVSLHDGNQRFGVLGAYETPMHGIGSDRRLLAYLESERADPA